MKKAGTVNSEISAFIIGSFEDWTKVRDIFLRFRIILNTNICTRYRNAISY